MTNSAGLCTTQYDCSYYQLKNKTTANSKATSVYKVAELLKTCDCWPVKRFVFSEANVCASDLLNKLHIKEKNETDLARGILVQF